MSSLFAVLAFSTLALYPALDFLYNKTYTLYWLLTHFYLLFCISSGVEIIPEDQVHHIENLSQKKMIEKHVKKPKQANKLQNDIPQQLESLLSKIKILHGRMVSLPVCL